MTRHARLAIILSIAILSVAGVYSLPPLAQDPEYHNFADKRAILGIANFYDVISNLPFLIVGVSGLMFQKTTWNDGNLDAPEKRLWLILFCSIALTSLGSAYYHFLPDNARLVWDRLFIALTLVALLSVIIAERMHCGWGAFPALALFAIASVAYWNYTEQKGAGDLRPYILAQFFPLAAIPAICALFPARHTPTRQLMFALGWYALAKLFEQFDQGIFEFIGVSGHTLKHLAAGMGALCLLRYLKRRQGVADEV